MDLYDVCIIDQVVTFLPHRMEWIYCRDWVSWIRYACMFIASNAIPPSPLPLILIYESRATTKMRLDLIKKIECVLILPYAAK
jgi:hypothetical protein